MLKEIKKAVIDIIVNIFTGMTVALVCITGISLILALLYYCWKFLIAFYVTGAIYMIGRKFRNARP